MLNLDRLCFKDKKGTMLMQMLRLSMFITLLFLFSSSIHSQVSGPHRGPRTVADQNNPDLQQADPKLNNAATGNSPAGQPIGSRNAASSAPNGPPAPASQRLTADTPSGSASSLQQITSAPIVAGGQPDIATYAIYRFFFLNIGLLEDAADRDERRGDTRRASLWRTHEQRAANLTETEGAMVKQVAFECNQAVKDEDAKIQAEISDFRAQARGDRSVPPPPEFVTLGDERKAIINAHIDKLREILGDSSFQKLDSYVHSAFRPQMINPRAPVSPTPKVQKEEQ
jgi:hypothetical protein